MTMKARVIDLEAGDGEAPVYDFEALPRHGERLVLPASADREEEIGYCVDRIVHRPADSDVRVDIFIRRTRTET